jgi:UDP-N-acetylmuramyl tripeptide synthase
VDYAHTPDALENVLTALREVRREAARIITVFGCGGDRDSGKRPLMAAAAQRGSEVVIVTSDNPRSEDPEKIIDMVMVGIDPQHGEVHRESDRRAAIGLALGLAKAGDIVLIAGKGHEDYQILGDRTIHFSDAEEVEKWFKKA